MEFKRALLRNSLLIKLEESLNDVRTLIISGDRHELPMALEKLECCQQNFEKFIVDFE